MADLIVTAVVLADGNQNKRIAARLVYCNDTGTACETAAAPMIDGVGMTGVIVLIGSCNMLRTFRDGRMRLIGSIMARRRHGVG